MITRNKVIAQAVEQCMKELYSYAVPKITWEEFIEENKKFVKKEEEYESLSLENKPSYNEYCGPKPYEFHYLPEEILKDICNSYVYAYKLDSQEELLNTIEILKDYCNNPIIDKYVPERTDENGDWHPGHKDYEHPENLKSVIRKLLKDFGVKDAGSLSEMAVYKFFKFLDMAGEFYNWNRDLNTFNMNVYLGASPNSNKEAVIKNWKKYKNQDIEIDDEQIKNEYYGDDE